MGKEAAGQGSHEPGKDPLDAGRPGKTTAAVRFRIGGALRFLSHAETMRLFQRACARADVPHAVNNSPTARTHSMPLFLFSTGRNL